MANEKLAANFIANINETVNSHCHKKFIDIYQWYILNGYDQIVFSADEVQNAFCKSHLKKKLVVWMNYLEIT